MEHLFLLRANSLNRRGIGELTDEQQELNAWSHAAGTPKHYARILLMSDEA